MITKTEAVTLLEEVAKGKSIDTIVTELTKKKKREIEDALDELKWSQCGFPLMAENLCDDLSREEYLGYLEFARDDRAKAFESVIANSQYEVMHLLKKMLVGEF